MIEIIQIPLLSDNYSYIIVDTDTNITGCIDPSVAKDIVNVLQNRGMDLNFILNTHHHQDHVGGNQELKEMYNCKIIGCYDDQNRIPGIDIKLKDSAILVLGITFKENCPDVRNTRVVDIIRNLEEYGAQVSVYDPQADAALVHEEYGYTLIPNLTGKRFSAIVLAVSHSEFAEFNLEELKAENAVVYDVKGFYKNGVDGRL